MPVGQSGKEGLPTWALVVSTYRRADVLLRCVTAALRQTVRPAEIVIVDASPDWTEARARVLALVRRADPNLPCRYVPAAVPILPAQRNQGIDLARADVLFMIDDDSLMFPDCAEEILKVYAADTGRRIAAVGAIDVPGLSPDAADFVPPPVAPAGADVPARPSLLQRLRWRVAQLYDRGEESFIPYDGWPEQGVPASCAHLAVSPCRTLNGFRMTFRREVIAKVRFVDWFVGSAPFEDVDATYRASHHGLVVCCLDARLTHLMYPSGRLDHFALAAFWVMNGAILLRLSAPGRPDLSRQWRRRVRRGMWLELIKDLAKRRFALPAFRGMWFGRRHLGLIERTPLDRLRSWYLAFQRRVRGDGDAGAAGGARAGALPEAPRIPPPGGGRAASVATVTAATR